MDSTAHASHGYFLYFFLHWLIWGTLVPPIYGAIIVICSILPDFDGLFFVFKGKDPHSNEFQHHLYFGTHWPITYIPLIVIFIITWIFNWIPEFFLALVVGVYGHLLADSACCGDGLMWTKSYDRTKFAPFINLFSKQTDGYHGGYWTVRWRKTKMYKIAFLEASVIVILNLFWMVQLFSWANLFVVLFFIGSMFGSCLPIDSKYFEEPEAGRYADYRKNPDYLAWMEENGFEFNDQMHVVKKNK